ncbi:hypothetical protein L6452_08226 [Arctium lappa]|uniref:Uncharacterized protein n=1 Tax=Arctium lappa TaxID=4217 RepID=A0ACB9DH16_ARCLA|nr:hypothetical protein L6452_08226 [Arctium lappa]
MSSLCLRSSLLTASSYKSSSLRSSSLTSIVQIVASHCRSEIFVSQIVVDSIRYSSSQIRSAERPGLRVALTYCLY